MFLQLKMISSIVYAIVWSCYSDRDLFQALENKNQDFGLELTFTFLQKDKKYDSEKIEL